MPQSTTVVDLVPEQEAERRTAKITELLPEQWRHDSITSHDMEGQVVQHKALLDAISRAVPLRLLLDETMHGLPGKSDKSQLSTSHFFLSRPASRFAAFVSHRWAVNPREVVTALLIHVILSNSRGALLAFGVCILVLAAFFIYPPAVVLALPLLSYAFMWYLVLAHRTRCLALLGHSQPNLWFDKATVHQTSRPLTQAGLSLFGHFLNASDSLLILFQPAYLTRVWCVYEFAYWLKNKGEEHIALVPLNTYNTLIRVALKLFPTVVVLVCAIVGFLVCFVMGLFVPLSLLSAELGADGAMWGVIVVVMVVAVAITACIGRCYDRMILGPAMKERRAVAQQLASFEVRNAQAFAPSDKEYVLGEICKWWDTAEGKEAALDAFNEFMRTRVARTLNTLQLQRERTVHCMVFIICATVDLAILVALLILQQAITPAAWPTLVLDVANLLSPPSCFADTLGLDMSCGSTTGVQVQQLFNQLSCVNGTLALPDIECTGFYATAGVSRMAVYFAAYVAVAIFMAAHAVWWASRSPYMNYAAKSAAQQPGMNQHV